jgi:hypothetical protein
MSVISDNSLGCDKCPLRPACCAAIEAVNDRALFSRVDGWNPVVACERDHPNHAAYMMYSLANSGRPGTWRLQHANR